MPSLWDQKCIGPDLYEYQQYWDASTGTTKIGWVLVEGNSPQCPVEPPPDDEELIYQNWLQTGGSGSISYWRSIGSPLYYTPEPTPTDEELIYQNWLRTGGTGSISYWRSIGSPLYYTPEPQTFHLSILVPSWAAGGYVEPSSGDYPINTTVTLRAYPLSGYQFTSWGGSASGVALTYNLYMNSDKNVEAYFEKIPVPEFKGSIVKKELEYDNTRISI